MSASPAGSTWLPSGRGTGVAARAEIAGARVDLLTTEQLTCEVVSLATSGRPRLVANHNLHSLYLVHAGVAGLADAFAAADIVHIDGMSLCVLARAAGVPVRRAHRTTYLDWVEPLMRAAATNRLRVFLLGGEPGVAEIAADRMRSLVDPEPAIGWADGYFDVDDEHELREVEARLSAFAPNIVLVGMGMPRQELWWLARREHLPPAAYLMAGGCFDYLAGRTATPPRVLGQLGLEWLYRLCRDPKRLARRYLVEPLHLAVLLHGRAAARRGAGGVDRVAP